MEMDFAKQILSDMKAETKVSYHKAPGIAEAEQVTLEGSQPCLFSAACVIVKAVVKNEPQERREELLDLIRDMVFDELKDEGEIQENVEAEDQKRIFVSCERVNGKVTTNVNGTVGDVMTLTTALLMKVGSAVADAEDLEIEDIIETITSTAIENSNNNSLGH